MTTSAEINFSLIRDAIAGLDLSPKVEPNAEITPEQAFLPAGHRGILDLKRQLVVGNRGMGKSFWTHALANPELRERLADFYDYPLLKNTRVEIGFNGSSAIGTFAPTVDEIASIHKEFGNPDQLWKAVLLRISLKICDDRTIDLQEANAELSRSPNAYAEALSRLDKSLASQQRHLLVVFDALDRLGSDWAIIRDLSRALLRLGIGLQSFRSIRAKIFMRVDQFSDEELFRFPDSSKIRNDHVSLVWLASELYGLLLFETLRGSQDAERELRSLAKSLSTTQALPVDGRDPRAHVDEQRQLIHALAGEFMGSNRKRGLVYTWVPLHLSDAANTCSPRTFLTAWKMAADHQPPPSNRAVDHLGLLDGVRSASTSRLNELYEDYPWIRPSLGALRRQLVPMTREQLFELWRDSKVIQEIKDSARTQGTNLPPGLVEGQEPETLLAAMKNVAVMEERSNGKINVPDIFRVDAGILRKGGVAVPRRS